MPSSWRRQHFEWTKKAKKDLDTWTFSLPSRPRATGTDVSLRWTHKMKIIWKSTQRPYPHCFCAWISAVGGRALWYTSQTFHANHRHQFTRTFQHVMWAFFWISTIIKYVWVVEKGITKHWEELFLIKAKCLIKTITTSPFLLTNLHFLNSNWVLS